MTFKELVEKFTWEELIPAFQHLYPDEKLEGYKVALEELRYLEPEPSNMEIELEFVLDEDGNYVDVHGVENGTVYGLDFVPWTEWLSMPIEHNTLLSYEAESLLVHCLWEITFYGFSNAEILEKRGEVFATVEEIESENAE